ncbi:hypothetical protein SBA1_530038 [Candidatus Sulfotelmatobacter kueseliae]|uniref:Cytochrome c assembly protein domain-containing protein n=1 Tax=Candidatus Sulfotelmatobacter kueseliae TaxID=2042962 RepID=A0A2U3KXM0_9BACT|nr:hypothetical protein SBA1_530038 [Candidatus Sulfotelmatobacter kueseliae]
MAAARSGAAFARRRRARPNYLQNDLYCLPPAHPDDRRRRLLGQPGLAYWANRAWGSYWNWDPKETWAAITWLVYAGYLHMRITRGWRGRRAAYFAILGFAVVMFTFFGVTYLLPGLHAYA